MTLAIIVSWETCFYFPSFMENLGIKSERHFVRKSFLPLISIVASPPFPFSSRLQRKKHRLSIQKAFSPFLSWPVNLFINCSGL